MSGGTIQKSILAIWWLGSLAVPHQPVAFLLTRPLKKSRLEHKTWMSRAKQTCSMSSACMARSAHMTHSVRWQGQPAVPVAVWMQLVVLPLRVRRTQIATAGEAPDGQRHLLLGRALPLLKDDLQHGLPPSHPVHPMHEDVRKG